MSLNCKPGDLAIIVRSSYDNTGKIVHVKRMLGLQPVWGGYKWCIGLSASSPCWLAEAVGSPINGARGDPWQEAPVPDIALRPLRDNPGEDEMLRIAGLPNRTKEHT